MWLRLRVKVPGIGGRAWWLSILWVVLGAALTGYTFFVTTRPFTNADFWIPLWNTEPTVLAITAYLAVAAWLVLAIPVLVAGFVQLRGPGPGSWLRAAAWVAAWVAGLALMRQTGVWSEYPAPNVTYGPAVVSWGELAICATWLALGAVMTLILAGQAHGSDIPDASSSGLILDLPAWPAALIGGAVEALCVAVHVTGAEVAAQAESRVPAVWLFPLVAGRSFGA